MAKDLNSPGLMKQGNFASLGPTWSKIATIGFADLSAAALTNDIELYELQAKEFIHSVLIVPTVAFSGGAVASFTLSVGIGGNLTKYHTAQNAFTGFVVTAQENSNFLESLTTTTSIRIAAVATGANLNALTAGSVDVYLSRSILPPIA